MEQRKDWKEIYQEVNDEKLIKQNELTLQLSEVRSQIRDCGNDYELYTVLKAKERELVAKLATL